MLGWKPREQAYFHRRIAPELDRLCKKWELQELYPPHWRFRKSDGTRRTKTGVVSLPTYFTPTLLTSDPNQLRELIESGFTGHGGSGRRWLQHVLLEFDLTWPLKENLEYARRALKLANDSYNDELASQGMPPTKNSRRRLRDYDEHLLVWELKQKKKTALEIARILFPSSLDGVGHSATLQKVHDHYAAAQRLIAGGYKEIR